MGQRHEFAMGYNINNLYNYKLSKCYIVLTNKQIPFKLLIL